MGWWDSFTEGLSAATQVVSTAAQAVQTVSNGINSVGKLIPLSEEVTNGDIPTAYELNHCFYNADLYLRQQAQDSLGTVRDPHKWEDIRTTFISGVVLKKKVIALSSRTDTSEDATPPIYHNIASWLSQTGAPLQGAYGSSGQLVDNARMLTDGLMVNSLEVDPSDAKSSVSTVPLDLNNSDGKTVFRVAYSGYNLVMDGTGLNNLSHSVFAYGVPVSVPKDVWSKSVSDQPGPRLRDIVPKQTKYPGGDKASRLDSQFGWQVTVNLQALDTDNLEIMLSELSAMETAAELTEVSRTVTGNVVTLVVQSNSPAVNIQPNIWGYFAGTWTGSQGGGVAKKVTFTPDNGVRVSAPVFIQM